ncbi:MAG: hypothetical protein HQ580_00635 [Planctomycetes bacterium]|nr:hypothetical protein [Planctomycetota bacterium]
MNFRNKSKTKCFWIERNFYLMMVLSAVLLLSLGKVSLAAENESTQHFKMLSTVEYSGKGQFRNQVEALFTVKKQLLDDDKVRYFLSTNDFDLVRTDMLEEAAGGSLDVGQQPSSGELSFVVDRKTKHLSVDNKDLALLEMVNNQCVKSLKKVTKENIGKTWKQSFNFPSLDKSLPDKLKFTLTAIQVETEVLGEMVAVRALSERFDVRAAKKKTGIGSIRSRIGAIYLFDPEIEDIYLSISVFEARTNINGSWEKLRHEVATYMTDAAGVSLDLSGLGKKFETLVRKLGLARKSFKVVKESPLPQWALSEGLNASQVAGICAATACEGASNPVVTVWIPVARTVAMQSRGTLDPVGGLAVADLGTVTGSLGTGVPAVGALNIAAAPAFLGVGVGTAAAVAGGTAGVIANNTDGAGSVTPASP